MFCYSTYSTKGTEIHILGFVFVFSKEYRSNVYKTWIMRLSYYMWNCTEDKNNIQNWNIRTVNMQNTFTQLLRWLWSKLCEPLITTCLKVYHRREAAHKVSCSDHLSGIMGWQFWQDNNNKYFPFNNGRSAGRKGTVPILPASLNQRDTDSDVCMLLVLRVSRC